MTPDLRNLYQEVIVEHGQRPRNFADLPNADHRAEGFNPLCGDRISLQLRISDGVIEDVRFTGAGCAISTASASLMSEALKGRTAAEAEQLFAGFHALLAGVPAADDAALGKLTVFAGVREFPGRIKCAMLPWHTLAAALHGEVQPVSTE